tara:strand:- start:67 stop:486 length:420 start_codon:yes stop_codon:yes gene_type:complete
MSLSLGNTTVLAGVTLLIASAHAVPTVDWFSVDSGGGVSTAGTLGLQGVIGQPDAGPELTFGTLELRGGFLAVTVPDAGPAGCNQADLAPPFGTLDLGDISAFVTAFTTNDLSVDFDNNSILDLADITVFVESITAGCN